MQPNNGYLYKLETRFKKRSKSLKNKGLYPELQKYLDSETGSLESIEMCFQAGQSRNSAKMAIRIWEDRRLILDMRQWSKTGWVWELRKEGRYIGAEFVSGLSEEIENTATKLSYASSHLAQLEARWSTLLANGPTEVPR